MIAKSENEKLREIAAAINEEKPFVYIVQNLENTFGEPKLRPKSDPLSMLINIILSQATSDVNSERTFGNLKKRFGNWRNVSEADESEIADEIRLGGLANQKAGVIKDLLRQIKETRKTLSLDFVEQMPDEAARDYLQSFRGIGPKTVACTLLFACHKEVFPLDTHIFRVLKRMGVLPAKITDAKAHKLLDELVPKGKFYSLHVNLIRLGREICRPREPLCEQCPLIEYCDYGATRV
ncbi:MAG: putative EndoIII-related endonuclease [Acidobacteria bacterium]|nr:putative EndoIII-related endonuclease [Acidobacteriota bacterium]